MSHFIKRINMKTIIAESVEISSMAWALLCLIKVIPTFIPGARAWDRYNVTIPAEHADLFVYKRGQGRIPGDLLASPAGADILDKGLHLVTAV
jgi:hypothetical protein